MGLYIKNLKMSEHCMDCPFMVSRDNDDCILQSDAVNESFETWEQMKAGCPLIEVPEPHGRLIDADALDIYQRAEASHAEYQEDENNEYLEGMADGLCEAAKQLSVARTIIPASEDG